MRLASKLARHKVYMGHVATLISGKAVAALIALFTTPIVSRLFIPSDFGVFALFVSIMLVVSNVASLRYEAAIVIPKEDKEALALMALAYRMMFCTCLVILVVLAIYEAFDLKLPALELLGNLRWLLPLAVLLMAAVHIQESWLTRRKSFYLASVSLVVGNTVANGTRIGLGWLLGSSIGGLVTGQLFGMIARLGIQKSAGRQGLQAVCDNPWSALREYARRYADFPKFNASAALILSLGQNLPVLLFGVMFSPAVAGFFAMANQLVRAPVAMITESVRRVFLQKAASIHNEGRSLQRAFALTSAGLAVLGAPVVALIWLFGQELATWFLSERWTVSGNYLEIIAPGLFALWVSSPCTAVFIVLRQQRLLLVLNIVVTVFQLAVFGVAYIWAAGPESTLRAFVFVGILGHAAKWVLAFVLIRRRPSSHPYPGRLPSGTKSNNE